ncbi:MAG: glutathione peroxidase [Pseudomonadales bacterium]|nr:glutathione peroxidase [Pseudomonadales bacterium]
MENMTGKRVPTVTFRTRTDEGWLDVTTEDLFAGKNVVVFSLPGAFTPTCSATHLPRYEELYDVFRQHGIDDILCVSVNDGFVMHAWQKDQAIKKVRMIPDGNGHFTRGMGMLVDKEYLGFGQRSWRYAMLVRDGVIDQMFIEPEKPGDPFEVSDADNVLAYVAPEATTPETVALISRVGCPHCQRAKALLEQKGIRYNEIVIGRDIEQTALRGLAGSTTVPQVFFGGKLIGGADELEVALSA